MQKSNSTMIHSNIISACLLFIVLSYLILQIVNGYYIQLIFSIIVTLIVVIILPSLRGTVLYVSLFLLFTGILLMIINDVNIVEWFLSFQINLPLVSIFIIVPLLGIPVRLGNYINALRAFFSDLLNQPLKFYISTSLLTHILSVIINIGSISIVYELTKASNIKSKRLIANILNRGYITSIFWSPYFSSMALILAYVSVDWKKIALYSMAFVVLTLLISLTLDWKLIKKENITIQKSENHSEQYEEIKKTKDSYMKIVELLIYILAITAIILLVEAKTSLSMVFVIIVISLIFPFVWERIYKRNKKYYNELIAHVDVTLPKMKSEIVLFLIAGFFSSAFVNSDFSTKLIEMLNFIFGDFYLGIAYFIAFLILLFALIGIHPIVLITVFVTGISPESLGFTPIFYALLLLTSFGVSNTVSVSTAVNNLLANLLQRSTLEVSYKWNMKFALITLVVNPFILYILKI